VQEDILRLCRIDARPLRVDLTQKEHKALIADFNNEQGKANILICSFLVSYSGPNLRICAEQ
tara:strand:+ start:260 stop:445 length:186 start_codon:yes stop_codon:yes gene_type:complete